ncbi:hypothetical protein ACF061_12550 [Streptomyces sp. NPDC015220]|uniref:hypothetical protein n=1 Tax=Streptomyces sp. NPDC015220 TaxID=3364947 RepID=UPI0036FBA876
MSVVSDAGDQDALLVGVSRWARLALAAAGEPAGDAGAPLDAVAVVVPGLARAPR